MILMIIFIVMLVVGIIGCICYSRFEMDSELHLGANLMLGGLGILGLIVGVIVIIMNNNSFSRSQARLVYEQNVAEFNATRNVIENIQDDYARSVAIQQYNTNVKEFKEDIITLQHYVNNPWISWFCNQEYKSFNVDVVSYITTF